MNKYGEPPFSPQQHPWLVIFHGADKQKQIFFSISEDRYYMRTIPELRNKKICECAHGWLVLLDSNSGDCYIWNPISNDKIQLPPLPDTRYNELQCLLSAPPHEPECCILFFDPPSSLYFCKPGTYNQEFHKYDLQPISKNSIMWFWTIFRGKLYGLSFQREILVLFDLDHDSGIVTATPMVNQPPDDFGEFLDMPHYACNLIQYDNDALLYVHMLYHGWQMQEIYGFLVFRFDFIEKTWVKVKSIGETAIFLEDYRGTICSTKGTNLKRESIYFTKHEDRRLYVFNLETQSLSVSLPCPHVSKKKSQFYWLTLPPKCN